MLEEIGLSLSTIGTGTMENKQKTILYDTRNASNRRDNMLLQALLRQGRQKVLLERGYIPLFYNEEELKRNHLNELRRRARHALHHRCLKGDQDFQRWLPQLIEKMKSAADKDNDGNRGPVSIYCFDVMPYVSVCPHCKDISDAPPRITRRKRRAAPVKQLLTEDDLRAADAQADDDADDSNDDEDFQYEEDGSDTERSDVDGDGDDEGAADEEWDEDLEVVLICKPGN